MATAAIAAFMDWAIVKGITLAAPHASDALQNKYCPEIVTSLKTVAAAQKAASDRLQSSINNLTVTVGIQQTLNDIADCHNQLSPAIARAELGDNADLLRIRTRVRDTIAGHLDIIHQQMLGSAAKNARPGVGSGIITMFMDECTKKVADTKDWEYHVSHLVRDVEAMMKYYINVQIVAFGLRIFFADEIDTKLNNPTTWETELRSRIDEQVIYAFNAYPAFVRLIMKDQFLGSRPIPGLHWRFRQQDNTSLYLAVADPKPWVMGQGTTDDRSKWIIEDLFDSNGPTVLRSVATGDTVHFVEPAESAMEAVVRMKDGTASWGPYGRGHAYANGQAVRWKMAVQASKTEASFRFVMDPPFAKMSKIDSGDWAPNFIKSPMFGEVWMLVPGEAV